MSALVRTAEMLNLLKCIIYRKDNECWHYMKQKAKIHPP